MTRLPAWQSLLDAFLGANRARRVQYGSFDCCLFACDAIHVMTGEDPGASFRGRYHSRREAVRAIREVTGRVSVSAVAGHVAHEHDMSAVTTPYLQRGDVALLKRRSDCSLGIVALNGYQVVVAASDGLEWVPISTASGGWRV